MYSYKRHIFQVGQSIKSALQLLEELAPDAVLFIVAFDGVLLGTLTDGDIRRGIIKGININSNVESFINKSPKVIQKDNYKIEDIIYYRKEDFRLIPVVNDKNKVINVINFRNFKSYLPVDAVIMAGGRGERLRPLTDCLPKPLLKIGEKPIIEHNIDRLIKFGVDDIFISIKYLGEKIESYFGDGSKKNVSIRYVTEEQPLGTIGAVSQVQDFNHDHILVSNSDILTNIDYEDFFIDYLNKDASLSIVTIPYTVNVPYAVLETNNDLVSGFKEKPAYTYFSNGGIYLIKKSALGFIPKNSFFNATDLIEMLIKNNEKVISYPLRGYWLDIGKHEDFTKAQEDIKHLTL